MSIDHTLRAGVRGLMRAWSFTLAATSTLALGIGLSIAVFTVADALLFRKLPVRDQNRLITLSGETRSHTAWPLDLADTRQFSRQSQTLSSIGYVAYEGAWPVSVISGGNLTRLRRALVSGNYFDVLGMQPAMGRTLRSSDDVVGAEPVAVISYATWQRQFGGAADVIGRQLRVQEFSLTYKVVGVAPEGLEYPHGADFWAPFVPARLRSENDTTAYTALDLVARLAPGATPEMAQAELSAYFTRPEASQASHDLRGTSQLLPRAILGDTRFAAIVFSSAAALLLLITCINVASLLLVRGVARTREVAIRSALGASKWRIVRQMLVENVSLAFIGGLAGIGVAAIAVRGFLAFAPTNIPLLDTVHLNGAALIGAIAITAFATLAFGVAPAVVTARTGVETALRAGARSTATRGSRVARETLVATQLALAMLVLTAAGLVGRSLLKLERADLAFDPSHLLIAELALPFDRYDSLDKQLAMLRDLMVQIRATPGIQAASPVVAIPFSGTGGWTGNAGIEGQTATEAKKNPLFNIEVVTPDYFNALGLHVLRGRAFTDADRQGAAPVVIVSEATARRYWPNQDPIGRRMRMGSRLDQLVTVVGVVPDTRYRDLRDAPASVYFPLAQSTFPFAPTTLVIRTTGSAAAVVPTLRRAIAVSAPGVALANAAPFQAYMAAPLAQPRLNAFLLTVFAFAAAALAAIGLFGVIATMVRQRTRELGIRMVLGATGRDIQALVVGRGLRLAGLGVGAGLAGSIVANRLLARLLYEVGPEDVGTLAVVAALLSVIALVATLIPARWSASIAPVVALRSDV